MLWAGLKGAGPLREPRRRKHWSGVLVSAANEGTAELALPERSAQRAAGPERTRGFPVLLATVTATENP